MKNQVQSHHQLILKIQHHQLLHLMHLLMLNLLHQTGSLQHHHQNHKQPLNYLKNQMNLKKDLLDLSLIHI